MAQTSLRRQYLSPGDPLILLLLGAIIYGTVATGAHWRSDYTPVTEIDLSLSALPSYTLFSTFRGFASYALSLFVTFIAGYAAAKSRKAEAIIIPMVDILQSIPVLGFLPGLVLGLMSLFPNNNVGLELTAIIMIFTSQAWNMIFSFYLSLKSIPEDYTEASHIMGLNWWQKLWRLEVPFASVNLVWNSLISVAGGWFFLSVCEAFTLGDKQFLLPGIGAYMSVAIKQGNTQAIIYGIIAMTLVIVLLDFALWRPVFAWVRRFRLEDTGESPVSEPLMLMMFRESRLIRWLKVTYRRQRLRVSHRLEKQDKSEPVPGKLPSIKKNVADVPWKKPAKIFEPFAWIVMITFVAYGSFRLFQVLHLVPWSKWEVLLVDTGLSLGRILAAIILSTLWALPAGIWIGTSPQRVRLAQPVLQIIASFPAPMLFPLILTIFMSIGMTLNWISIILMVFAVHWYILFNVLAGAMRISQELQDALALMNLSRYEKWKKLYIPSIFPTLVLGWMTAAGGAWNASIVAEYIAYKGDIITARGLGSAISQAAAAADFPMLAASLTLMVTVVLFFNRTVWKLLYNLAQTRYRMEV